MQQYFKTGKTIVIDDQYNEAKPLLDALSRNQIPFLYTQGKPNSEFPLPNTNPEDAQYYSLMFLDLNLDFKFAGSQIGNDSEEKTFKGTHAQILNTIIKNNNRSFIIVIWSNEEENFLEHYLKLFEELKYTDKRPYKIISLNKSKFFSLTQNGYEFNKDHRGETKPYEDLLFEEINNALEDLDAFKLFCEWDRVISQSVSDAIDDFMGLINNIPDEDDREEHLAKVITAISIAYSGVDGYLKFKTNEEKTDSVLLALTQILNDDIDRNVLIERQKEFTKWKATSKSEVKKINSSINASLINRKLLVFKPNRKDLTGSVYLLPRDKDYFENVFFDSFNSSAISKDFIKQYKKDHSNVNPEFLEKIERKYSLTILLKSTIPIELNISPLCDVVQSKIIYHRLIKGLIIPADCGDKIGKSDYFIKTPVFALDGKDFFLGFDLRTFSSCSIDEVFKKDYSFTLRTTLINDIQTKLAAHVSRLGVLYL